MGMPRMFSGIVLNEGDDIEIAGVLNSRNHWLEAARMHNHTTGATWELNLRRVATDGCSPVALALLSVTAVLVLCMGAEEVCSLTLRSGGWAAPATKL